MNPWIKQTEKKILNEPLSPISTMLVHIKRNGEKKKKNNKWRYFESHVFSKMKPEQCLRQPGGGKVRHKVVARHRERETGSD